MTRFIKTAAECNVKQFKACAFENKYRVLVLEGDPTEEELQKAFELIYAEYSDLSGLFINREFDLSAYIHSLQTRLTVVKESVDLQHIFTAELQEPFVPGFKLLKKYGHYLSWDREKPNLEAFLNSLDKIPQKEVRYQLELKNKQKELLDLHTKHVKKEFTLLESRKQFMTSIVRLKQQRFEISNETSVEELALAIADSREMNETVKAQRQFNKRAY